MLRPWREAAERDGQRVDVAEPTAKTTLAPFNAYGCEPDDHGEHVARGAAIVRGTGDHERPRVVRLNGRLFGEADVFELAKARLGRVPRS